jgi:hypothetical protein
MWWWGWTNGRVHTHPVERERKKKEEEKKIEKQCFDESN